MAAELVIFLVIIGAGAAVCIGWAIYNHYRTRLNSSDMQDNREAEMEQTQYMREVRFRNKEDLTRMYGYRAPSVARGLGYGPERQDYDDRSSAW